MCRFVKVVFLGATGIAFTGCGDANFEGRFCGQDSGEYGEVYFNGEGTVTQSIEGIPTVQELSYQKTKGGIEV